MSIETIISQYIIDEKLSENVLTKIDPDDSLISSGVLDSMALLQLIAFVEQRFGITVDDDEVNLENFQTVNNIKALVEKKSQNQ